MATNKIPITITYRKAGTQPPIFVAGSFSDPAWIPQEMEFSTDKDGEHTFKMPLTAEEGSQIQYKFRVGLGDWWVLNEGSPTVTDDMGNRNNVVEVKRPASKGPLQALKSDVPEARSGASTPGFVRTAAEVADSAALLDKEPPESEIPDDEAGRLGFRRLSATPMPEVAATAAEVAETARWLDQTVEMEENSSPPLLAHERLSGPKGLGEDLEQDGPPLFAHECPDPMVNDTSSQRNRRASMQSTSTHDYEVEDFDLSDPSLERFPSNRNEIMEQVRRISTELEEDRPSFEGAPLSPVIGPGRRKSADFGGEYLSLSPSTSPILPRPVKRLDIPRGSQGSQTPDRSSSAVSLQSIEEDIAAEGDVDDVVVLLPSPPRSSKLFPKPPASDDDEGVALKGSGEFSGQETTKHPQHGPSSQEAQSGSPKIVIHRTDSTASSHDTDPIGGARQGSPKSIPTPTTKASERVSKDMAGSAVGGEDSSSRLRKRTQAERAGTPTSIHSPSVDAVKNSGWIRTFFRLVFVDWIGGFFRRLWGGNRNA